MGTKVGKMIINRPKFKEIEKEHITDASVYMSDEYVMEPKMDGIWGAMHIKDGKYQIWSRTGQLKQEGECISPLSSNEMCILGEFMFGSNWAKKHDKVGQFFAFDMVQWDGDWDFSDKPFETRRGLLKATLASLPNCFPDFVELNQQWKTYEIYDVWDDYVVGRKYEGLILKKTDESYMDATWVKIKYRTDIDYVCMGFSDGGEGTKYEDTVGSIIGGLYKDDDFTDERELVDVCHVGGLTVAQRDIFNKNKDYFKGKVFTAKGFNIFDSGAIRHGKFKSFRTDKLPQDCDMTQVPSDAEYMP